jgi:hypothetical protein
MMAKAGALPRLMVIHQMADPPDLEVDLHREFDDDPGPALCLSTSNDKCAAVY